MIDLAKALQQYVASIQNDDERIDAMQALEMLPAINLDVVSEESANKGLPRIRKAALHGFPSMIARRGRIQPSGEAAVVMSAGQLASLLGLIFGGAEKRVAARHSASAILSQLEPTHESVVRFRVGRRGTEETVGGRTRLL